MNLRTLALTPLALLALCQCSSFKGPADSTNPTVEEQDALDVKWGLPPRKNKGNVRRVVPDYDKIKKEQETTTIPKIGDQPSSDSSSSDASSFDSGTSNASSSAPTTVDPSVLQKLR